MRLVIVHRDAPDTDGVLIGFVGEERAREIRSRAEQSRREFGDKLVKAGSAGWPGGVGGLAGRLILETAAADRWREHVLTSAGADGLSISAMPVEEVYLDGFRDGLLHRDGADGHVVEVEHAGRVARVVPAAETDDLGGAVGLMITADSWPVRLEAFLFGGVNVQSQLPAVLGADGGNSAVHVVSQRRARAMLRRQGGGVIEDGIYALHPKRPGVLVPFLTYHQELLAEMQREARVTMGRLGAKRLMIETVEGVSFGGSMVSRVPLKSGGVDFHGASKDERTVTYEWGSPTYDPDKALEDCVLLQDNAGVMTIVDQRRTSNLTKFEEFSRIDTQFGVGLDLMGLFRTGFTWAKQSTYRYTIEFFSRSSG